ncbi:hypothetical protein M413DRAFT_285678 [Hebeloma cylindrosporum]|uniref:Uncharacterized protein n=1 Tax=Hebeloma cylindrosporum TaxID=76867 RepID=A0A0C2XFC7_HEBCY|nr:hypothetical protein M413DRAFT_285678 [Hebeloma cylindrosporum h7]
MRSTQGADPSVRICNRSTLPPLKEKKTKVKRQHRTYTTHQWTPSLTSPSPPLPSPPTRRTVDPVVTPIASSLEWGAPVHSRPISLV